MSVLSIGPSLVSAAETTLFSGGALGWANRFGSLGGTSDPLVIVPIDTVPTVVSHFLPACPLQVVQVPPAVHAEAQRVGVIGADFTYTAGLTVASNAEVHLQFRIADQGRYGVKLSPAGAAFYRLERLPETCDCTNSSTFTHCPNWPPLPQTICEQDQQHGFGCDDPQYQELATDDRTLAPGSPHQLSIRAQDSRFQVFLDGAQLFHGDVVDDTLKVGRFGIYVFGATDADVKNVSFRNVAATADPTQLSNFALLYSTAGYELAGTKRALVRTLNDLPEAMYIAQPSRFFVTQCRKASIVTICDGPVKSGTLAPQPAPGLGVSFRRSEDVLPRTFGMQLLEADFTTLVTSAGLYRLRVDIGTTSGLRTLTSDIFAVQSRLASAALLKPLSILNAETRRAADDDMRRNWCFETASGCSNDSVDRGPWSVALDGAFWADRADAIRGAVVRRVFDDNNAPLDVTDFRYVGQIAIISGCDAQMQFRVTPSERLAVTLQAESGGGCSLLGGPGAVRLSRETSDGGFETLATAPFPADHPFEAGHPYDVDIVVRGDTVTVKVDDGRIVSLDARGVPVHGGSFALKAFASTARFARVQAWVADVDLLQSPALDDASVLGTRIGRYADPTAGEALVRCQDFLVPRPQDFDVGEHNACYPIFSQLHGFHDANNIIGEATSHGTFLAGLTELWTARASIFSGDERERLRQAIQTNALYLEELFQQGAAPVPFTDEFLVGFTGEFAHSEMGRGGVDTNLGSHQSIDALYGESVFADKGAFVDRTLADRACQNAIRGAAWLAENHLFDDTTQQSAIYAHIAHCLERDPEGSGLAAQYWQMAADAARQVLDAYSGPDGAMVTLPRDTGRVIPWFEGVYEVLASHPYLQCAAGRLCLEQVEGIADLLISHLTRSHVCNDRAEGDTCPANAFLVIPQGSGDAKIATDDWQDMQRVPQVDRPVAVQNVTDPEAPKFLKVYNSQGHFPAAAADAVYLWRLTGKSDLERIASGNYYWMLGLNPGVPSQKVVNGIGNGPWQAAAFIRGLDHAFGRVFEGYRTNFTSSKGSPLAPWEENAASPRREAWFVDIQDNGYRSTVNGHVIWDDQWDYWNVGKYGWASGETFILGDGAFMKAALLYEDRLTPSPRANPYDTTHLEFFDTTHLDRLDSGWLFDDPDYAPYAQAGRSATGFCDDKGFNGGRFTGHYVGERDGVLCTPATAAFFDATDAEVDATGWGFADINTAPWAQVARAATGFCNARGYVGGFATGHQLNGRRGMVCLGSDVAHWFDSTGQDLFNSGEGFTDIDTVPWAKAARAATNICLTRQYAGGFFTGHQVNDLHGVVCLAR